MKNRMTLCVGLVGLLLASCGANDASPSSAPPAESSAATVIAPSSSTASATAAPATSAAATTSVLAGVLTAQLVGQEDFGGLRANHFVFNETNTRSFASYTPENPSPTVEGDFYLAQEGNYVLYAHSKETSPGRSYEVTEAMSFIGQLGETTLPDDMAPMSQALDVGLGHVLRHSDVVSQRSMSRSSSSCRPFRSVRQRSSALRPLGTRGGANERDFVVPSSSYAGLPSRQAVTSAITGVLQFRRTRVDVQVSEYSGEWMGFVGDAINCDTQGLEARDRHPR